MVSTCLALWVVGISRPMKTILFSWGTHKYKNWSPQTSHKNKNKNGAEKNGVISVATMYYFLATALC
jgi:hypothetical protein